MEGAFLHSPKPGCDGAKPGGPTAIAVPTKRRIV